MNSSNCHPRVSAARLASALGCPWCAGWGYYSNIRSNSTPAPLPEPEIGDAARKLIAQIRRIFGECLDVEISPSNVNVLCGILAVIRDSAGIALPTDEDTLCRLLPDVGS